MTAQASRPVAVPADAVTRLEPLVGRWDWTGASTDKSGPRQIRMNYPDLRRDPGETLNPR